MLRKREREPSVRGRGPVRSLIARPAYSRNEIGFRIVPLDRPVRQSTIGTSAFGSQSRRSKCESCSY
jgi:hypothetical protein